MNSRFMVLFGALLAGLTMLTTATAFEAKDLVGVWEMTKGERVGYTYEFTADGKLKVNEKDSKNPPLVGAYTVMEKELSFRMTFDGKTEKKTLTLVKITEKELVVLDPDKKEIEFKRVK